MGAMLFITTGNSIAGMARSYGGNTQRAPEGRGQGSARAAR